MNNSMFFGTHQLTIKMVFSAIFIPLFWGCFFQKEKQKQVIKKSLQGVRLKYQVQFYSLEYNHIINIRDSIDIFYHDKNIVYKFSTPYETKRIEFDSTNLAIDKELLEEGVRHSYFICKKGEEYGSFFDSLQSNTPKTLRADSLLGKKISIQESMFDVTNENLVEVLNLPNKDFIEIYVPLKKIDDSYADSSYYFFRNDMKGIQYSFSPRIDSIKQRKLSKVSFVYNSFVHKESNKEIPRREYLFEISPIPDNNKSGILYLINKATL